LTPSQKKTHFYLYIDVSIVLENQGRGKMRRREFLKHAGCAAGCAFAGVGVHSLFPLTASSASAETFSKFDRATQVKLAEMALDLAKQAGAAYCDVRIGRNESEFAQARENRLEAFGSSLSIGVGVRVLMNGSWGFASSETPDEGAIKRLVGLAMENARANALIQSSPIVLEEIPAYREDWIMPMKVDPFSVSVDDKTAKLLAVNGAAMKAGGNYCTSDLMFSREEKVFASSRGSLIGQTRVRSYADFQVTAVDKSTGKFASVASRAAPRGAGWEAVEGHDFVNEATASAEQAQRKIGAKPVEPGRYDLVIDPSNLYLTIHETVGHATELDRALGWEANYAGTSFVTPDKLGKLQYGSPLMNIRAERSQEGGLATVGFDDDGVRTAGAEFAIVENGVFQNYQMAMGQAQFIGRRGSNGCAYADHPTSFPLQRMPNISLQPNPTTTSLDDLFADVKDGIHIVGAGSWSIDQQRDNFQFGGQLFYEIKNGKRGEMLRDVAYQGRTLEFWNALDGLGDKSTYFLGGAANCGKGEPPQSAPVSHGAPATRFRQVAVLNTERKDL
jgi:TldD protein